ncbi:hypothetical protein [Agrobacterium tumefaciens]|uniref:hypothetical protein n=1 Tax=Agrobacterium tumefaciens TaxID=358 RepID=UPI001572D333|nr:ninG protein [Agrobacterium tumefaciens]
MRWQKGRDRDGKPIERVAVSDAGYKVALFTVSGNDLFRASYQGEFIHQPVTTKQEAVAACNAHEKEAKKP